MQTTSPGETEIAYVRWLLLRIGGLSNEIIFLCRTLLSIEFYSVMEDDNNRAKDATDIRDEYIAESGIQAIDGLLMAPSVLEVLVALSERATMMDFDPPSKWFCLFLENLGFGYLTDEKWSDDAERYVRATIRKWLDRRFSYNGVGSPFRGNGTYDVSKTTMWNSLQWYLSNSFGGETI